MRPNQNPGLRVWLNRITLLSGKSTSKSDFGMGICFFFSKIRNRFLWSMKKPPPKGRSPRQPARGGNLCAVKYAFVRDAEPVGSGLGTAPFPDQWSGRFNLPSGGVPALPRLFTSYPSSSSPAAAWSPVHEVPWTGHRPSSEVRSRQLFGRT